MSAEVRSSGKRRVVVLLGPSASAPELPDSVEVVQTASGYEAAAELLSAPTSALLVDLGRITSPHVPLLPLAGKLEVPVVAFGTVSTSLPGSALAALRLVSAENVREAVAEALSARPAVEAAKPTEAPTEPAPAEKPPEPAPRRAKLTPAKPAAPEAAPQQAEPPGPESQAPPQPTPPQRARETLTQAELDALLGELDALLEDNP